MPLLPEVTLGCQSWRSTTDYPPEAGRQRIARIRAGGTVRPRRIPSVFLAFSFGYVTHQTVIAALRPVPHYEAPFSAETVDATRIRL